jgi:alpha-D-ribose 1-methylphosphonate 5-triphosphate diphosphatase
MRETILTNARLVLPDALTVGTVVLHGAVIAEVQPGRSRVAAARDLDGDTLIPGIVDLHTDNLERQVQPRLNARWPSRSALLAHDAQCAAAGVTTVLDALCVGDLGFDLGRARTFADGIADLDALLAAGLLRSEHFLHLRCEVPAVNVLDRLDHAIAHPRVRMVSLMDHSPGVGQYADIERFRALRRKEGLREEEIDARIAALRDQRAALRDPHRRALLARVAERPVALASHDDRSPADVAENHADGIRISEFPVTLEAARAAKAHGMDVIAGAPNVVRGGSHSGNVAAADLIAADAVDALASDYVPASLVEAAFRCAEAGAVTLPRALALVTEQPARIAGLADRGRIAPGLRADLVRVRPFEDLPVVREVWRAGERAA